MIATLPFNEHVAEYEEWFEKYPFVFQSEVAALRSMLPVGNGLRGMEIAMGTGRFSVALGIKEGIEPAFHMRELARKRGLEVLSAVAEHLPYRDLSFDLILMVFCISYFEDIGASFREANRVLKAGGSLVVGFVDKDSPIGKYYEKRKPESVFYKQANFYSTKKIVADLKEAGFRKLHYAQTLFHGLDEITQQEPVKPGYGEGSFIVIQAIK